MRGIDGEFSEREMVGSLLVCTGVAVGRCFGDSNSGRCVSGLVVGRYLFVCCGRNPDRDQYISQQKRQRARAHKSIAKVEAASRICRAGPIRSTSGTAGTRHDIDTCEARWTYLRED